jgi:hypothetical protein
MPPPMSRYQGFSGFSWITEKKGWRDARRLADWLTSAEGQSAIGGQAENPDLHPHYFNSLDGRRDRFVVDSALERAGFEPVWGFSCQVVFLVCWRFFGVRTAVEPVTNDENPEDVA